MTMKNEIINSKQNFFLSKKKRSSFPLILSNEIPILSEETLNKIEIISKKSKKKKIKNSNDENNKFLKNYLSSISLKEKYEDLIQRNNLILPPKYKILLKKQKFLDIFLTNKNYFNFHTFDYIKNSFKTNIQTNFNQNDFQQILFITPFFYIYQSKQKINGEIELICIDIPIDYEKRMKMKFNKNTNFYVLQTPKNYEIYKGNINEIVFDKRNFMFKNILEDYTIEQHEIFLKKNHFDYFDARKCKTWHHLFDINNVNEIDYFPLIENNLTDYKKLLIR